LDQRTEGLAQCLESLVGEATDAQLLEHADELPIENHNIK